MEHMQNRDQEGKRNIDILPPIWAILELKWEDKEDLFYVFVSF